ncbi:MAG: peptide chain release factor 2 [Candidatus Goldiibacteriota bacterium HGW-Goldbacteria-1]|nr:MAG: peptide chain release factor 2 [Candidatus Goldiibacteriota bacterium HGW-Goldbacteria-1]
MEIKEIKDRISEIRERVSKVRCIFDLPKRILRRGELERKSQEPNFWKDTREAKKVQTEIKGVTYDIQRHAELKAAFEEIETVLELLDAEKDAQLEAELQTKFVSLMKFLERTEVTLLFSGQYDKNNAIVKIHAGAGGTESCDWVSMLYRMYKMWCENKGFKIEVSDIMHGDETGFKDITFEVAGEYAYGNFRSEKGIHRLVRISPFDSNKRRHTTFASLEVIPELDDEVVVDIKEEDLRIDTFRASGAGGQHVNRTESAIRITHIPTNIVVQCQNDRSQGKNKEMAMKELKARLFIFEEEKKKLEMEEIAGEKRSISWGSQIRSYVLHPYKMIKDLRTGYERGDVDNVLDGDLDEFIEAFLKFEAERNINGQNKS